MYSHRLSNGYCTLALSNAINLQVLYIGQKCLKLNVFKHIPCVALKCRYKATYRYIQNQFHNHV